MTNDPHESPDCCSELRRGTSRRTVLKGATAIGGGLALTQMFGESMMQASFAGAPGGNTLVVLSLRGGIDGLGVVVPHGDPGYYAARPGTAVPAGALICKDALFGLHPKMAPLEPFWRSKELAAVQAVGLAVPNRSHFSAIEDIEDAAPGSTTRSGWINRMVGLSGTDRPVNAVQLGNGFPTEALQGPASVLAATQLSELKIRATDAGWESARYSSLESVWRGSQSVLARAAADTISVSKTVADPIAAASSNAAAYPTSWGAQPFVEPLKSAAQLIRADLGTDVIAIDAGIWDFHTGYGTPTYGSMQASVDGFAQALAGFLTDLGTLRSRVTVVTISEFGRRVTENGSGGFDHGWGNMMLLAGAGVKGGQYYGTWPRLDAANLAEGDLKVTTDYRNVLGEIAARRFPGRSLSTLFPGLSYNPLGFMA